MEKQAVIQFQGHQYLIKEGQEIQVDRLPGKKGEKIKFDQVLLLIKGKDKAEIGTPFLKKVLVEGVIEKQFKGEKITVRRYKAKSRYRKVKGFRPSLTLIKIKKITNGQK